MESGNNALFSGFLVRNFDGLEYGLKFRDKYNGAVFNIYTDAGFYIWNRHTQHRLNDTIAGFCLPYELNKSEQYDILGILPAEKVVYGRIPMMHSAGCVLKTTSGCIHGNANSAVLTDRYNKNFPVAVNCIHCMNTIYNCVPLSLHAELQKFIKSKSKGSEKKSKNKFQTGCGFNFGFDLRLDFTLEDAEETSAVLEYFDTLFNGEGAITAAPALPFNEYTTGHEKRGVE
jgi:putative protease